MADTRWQATNATLACVLICSLLRPGIAQDNATRRHEQVIALLKSQAADITAQSLADIQTLDDWQRSRVRQKREYLYMLGLDPLPERTPLQARITGTLDRPGYRVEKTVFQSLPGLYVTGNFYLPRGRQQRLPTILYVCGHSPHPQGAKWSYQDRAQWFAEHGYTCLVIDTLEFGEVAGIHHGLHNLNMWRWLSTGFTPAGVEVWNAIRAIDYLETREEVDKDRIGITGISGGGAVSWYTAAADERIAVAVPVCGTFTFGSQASNWLADGQCDCIYFHNTFQSDLTVVASLIAPRPLLICSGRKDSIFPPDGYHDVYRQTKRIYDLHADSGEGSDRIREVEDDVPHQDSPLLRKETRQWLNRWLKDDGTPLEIEANPTEKAISAEDLSCLENLPRDATNFGIHDTFVRTATLQVQDEPVQWAERRQQLLAELHDKTFRWFPTAEVPFGAIPNGGSGAWIDRYADYKDVQIQSEPNCFIRVQLLKARRREAGVPLLIYAERSSDSLSSVDVDELLPLLGRCDVAIVNARLTDRTLTAAEFTNIERTAAWTGRTIAAMQVWDILRAHRWLLKEESLTPAWTAVLAKDEMTVPSLYATLLDDKIQQLIVHNLPSSHQHAPPLLNVLRFTDIPEVAAAIAPRRLTFLGSRSADFQFTERMYGLSGSADQLTTAVSVADALEIWNWKSEIED